MFFRERLARLVKCHTDRFRRQPELVRDLSIAHFGEITHRNDLSLTIWQFRDGAANPTALFLCNGIRFWTTSSTVVGSQGVEFADGSWGREPLSQTVDGSPCNGATNPTSPVGDIFRLKFSQCLQHDVLDRILGVMGVTQNSPSGFIRHRHVFSDDVFPTAQSKSGQMTGCEWDANNRMSSDSPKRLPRKSEICEKTSRPVRYPAPIAGMGTSLFLPFEGFDMHVDVANPRHLGHQSILHFVAYSVTLVYRMISVDLHMDLDKKLQSAPSDAQLLNRQNVVDRRREFPDESYGFRVSLLIHELASGREKHSNTRHGQQGANQNGNKGVDVGAKVSQVGRAD